MDKDIQSGDPILQAQDAAYQAGLTPDQFGRLTPFELNIFLSSVHERRQKEVNIKQELDLISGYQTIHYLSCAMSKRGMPPLKIELERLRAGGSGELSPEASAEAMRSWVGNSAKE